MKKYLSVLCFIFGSSCMLLNSRRPDLIKSFKIINKNKIVVKANKPFSREFIKEDFFAEYDESIDLTSLDESIVTIPFILTIIPVVWVCNKSYSINVMDKDLYYSLQKIKEVFKLFYPEQKWAGELIPRQLVTNTIIPVTISDEPTLAMLFSGGLDAVDNSMSHSDIKQLLITAWGSDVPLYKTDMWAGVFKKCQHFAEVYGHECISIKSNFKEFIEEKWGRTQKNLRSKLHKVPGAWWLYTSQALSYTGLTAPILVARNISTLLIGSSRTIENSDPNGTHPAIDNNISFAGSAIYYYGEKSRVQKVMNINTLCEKKGLPLPYLRPCWNRDPNGENCLNCNKCLYTAINIIAAGGVPQEFGLDIKINEIIERSKKLLYKIKLRPWQWECSFFYLDMMSKQTKASPVFSNQDVQALRDFLHSIDFEDCKKYHANAYSPQEWELFTTLWKQNIKRYRFFHKGV